MPAVRVMRESERDEVVVFAVLDSRDMADPVLCFNRFTKRRRLPVRKLDLGPTHCITFYF
jgi:hypothetical protein